MLAVRQVLRCCHPLKQRLHVPNARSFRKHHLPNIEDDTLRRYLHSLVREPLQLRALGLRWQHRQPAPASTA